MNRLSLALAGLVIGTASLAASQGSVRQPPPTAPTGARIGGATTGQPSELAEPQRDPKIAPRDLLNIAVIGVQEFTGKFHVDLDGTFEYPHLGRVRAAGFTPRELQMDLTKQLEAGYIRSPQVTVELEQFANKSFSIAGAVKAPGTYQYAGDLTLLQAIIKAGSTVNEWADEAVVVRGTQATHVDIFELLTGKSMVNNVDLRDGDTVIINNASPVFVTGYVGTPGQYPVRRGTTVLQALSLAGGVTELGNAKGTKITRMVNGTKKEISVNKQLSDIVLPGDTLVVPRRKM